MPEYKVKTHKRKYVPRKKAVDEFDKLFNPGAKVTLRDGSITYTVSKALLDRNKEPCVYVANNSDPVKLKDIKSI